MNKAKKIYHYAPFSPAFTACKIQECSYCYTTVVAEVNCKDCLKVMDEKMTVPKEVNRETKD